MSRHPYTNSCDFIRQAPMLPADSECRISRAEASQIRQAIAEAIGMPDEVLAEKLSLAFKAKATPEAA